MAFTDEDKKEIADMIAAASKPADPVTPVTPAVTETTINDEARANVAAAAEEKRREQETAGAIKFNGGIKSFVTENADSFGGEDVASSLLGLLGERTKNDSEVVRANEIRKTFIDEWIGKQSNLDILPAGLLDEVARYRELPESDKRQQSSVFWKIVESGVEIQKQMKKADQIAIAHATGSDTVTAVPSNIWTPSSK